MDAVGNSSWCQATAAQGCFVGGQQQIVMIHSQLAQLHTIMISMATSISAHPLQIAHPDLTKYKGFMLQYPLYFSYQEGLSEHTKIAHFTNLLTDEVLTWATTIRNQGGEQTASNEHFLQLFQCVFNYFLEGP